MSHLDTGASRIFKNVLTFFPPFLGPNIENLGLKSKNVTKYGIVHIDKIQQRIHHTVNFLDLGTPVI